MTAEKLELQDLREQVQQLKLKEHKLNFLLSNMHCMCVHNVTRLACVQGDPKPRVTIFVDHIHFLEKDRNVGEVVMDTESFDAQIVKLMKEAGK